MRTLHFLLAVVAANDTRDETCKDQLFAENCENVCEQQAGECYLQCDQENPRDCLLECSKQQTECENDCPCHCNCPNGCPCPGGPDWRCPSKLECEDLFEDEASACVNVCSGIQTGCSAQCSPFDLVCLNSCLNGNKNCLKQCPCNNMVDTTPNALFQLNHKKVMIWKGGAEDAVQYTATNFDNKDYNDFGSCHIIIDNKHWFIGGTELGNYDKIMFLDLFGDKPCELQQHGVGPKMSDHSCVEFKGKVYACASNNFGEEAHIDRCIGFSLDFTEWEMMGTMNYGHNKGFSFTGYAGGRDYMIVGTGFNNKLEITWDGQEFVEINDYPIEVWAAVTASIHDSRYVFGGYSRGAVTDVYRFTETWDYHNNFRGYWTRMPSMLSARDYASVIFNPLENSIIIAHGSAYESLYPYPEQWTNFNETSSLDFVDQAYTLSYYDTQARHVLHVPEKVIRQCANIGV